MNQNEAAEEVIRIRKDIDKNNSDTIDYSEFVAASNRLLMNIKKQETQEWRLITCFLFIKNLHSNMRDLKEYIAMKVAAGDHDLMILKINSFKYKFQNKLNQNIQIQY